MWFRASTPLVLLSSLGVIKPSFAAFTSIRTGGSGSVATEIDLPAIYPALNPDTVSKECQLAWNYLDRFECPKSVITSQVWDDGEWDYRINWDLPKNVPLICSDKCKKNLDWALERIRAYCPTPDSLAGKSAWNWDTYKGEEDKNVIKREKIDAGGPAEVIEKAHARVSHMCKKSRRDDTLGTPSGYCIADVFEQWEILDGLNPNPKALDRFLEVTQYRKSVRFGGTHMVGGNGWSESTAVKSGVRYLGPGPGETDCNWCTTEWLLSFWGGYWREVEMGRRQADEEGWMAWFKKVDKAGERCKGWKSATVSAKIDLQSRGRLPSDMEIQGIPDPDYIHPDHKPRLSPPPPYIFDLSETSNSTQSPITQNEVVNDGPKPVLEPYKKSTQSSVYTPPNLNYTRRSRRSSKSLVITLIVFTGGISMLGLANYVRLALARQRRVRLV